MAELIRIEKRDRKPFEYCRELEKGNILFFSKPPFEFPQDEIDFLLRQKQGSSKGRKNIAYKPQLDRITNYETKDPKEAERLKEILRNYSKRVTSFLTELLAPYAERWKHDYASFRPFQEKGRKLRLRARNDLLHCDAFPTRPTHGARIFRFFTNINPTESRRWITSKPFGELLKEFGGSSELPFPRAVGHSMVEKQMRKMKELLVSLGVKIPMRSPYDSFMLRMHNFLKENGEFQSSCSKDHWDFPPGSCWAVFTDQVSHAALSGQYALEQTFLIPFKAMLFPDLSPVGILEQLTGQNLINFEYSST